MKHRIVSFEELVAPLSRGKLMVVVECLNIEGCDQPEMMGELSELLDLGFGSGYDEWEDFLDFGYVVMEAENKPEYLAEATLLIDFLRSEKFQTIVQADLFVDGILQASSWNGEPEVWNLSGEGMKPNKSVVIRFPVEKIKRQNESETKN